jgi:hypothetical protein
MLSKPWTLRRSVTVAATRPDAMIVGSKGTKWRKQMLNTIPDEAWEHVRKEFPEVWAFLVHASLKGELKSLQREPNTNDWQKRRLEELTSLFDSQYELAKEVGRYRKMEKK